MKKSFSRALILIPFALALGCGGGGSDGGKVVTASTPGYPPSCPNNGLPTLPVQCCDQAGNVRANDGREECNQKKFTPEVTTAAGFQAAAAQAARSAGSAIAEAEKLTGKTPTHGMSAATADTHPGQPAPLEPGPEAAANLPEVPSAEEKNDRKGGSEGGGGGAGAASGGSLASGISTAPAAPQTVAAVAAPAQQAGGAYSGGGGGGAAKGRGGSGDDPFGSLMGGGGAGFGGGPKSESFQSNDRAVAAVVGEDPIDYFQRTSLNDNLFKIVERRYRNKSTSWALENAAEIRRRVGR